MDYLKELNFPLKMSGMLFGLSILVFLTIDFYAVVLSLTYLVLGSISSLGLRYLEITGQSQTAKALLKMFIESPSYFFLVLDLFYVLTGDFYWLFFVVAAFIAFINFALGFSELTWKNEKNKTENEIDSI